MATVILNPSTEEPAGKGTDDMHRLISDIPLYGDVGDREVKTWPRPMQMNCAAFISGSFPPYVFSEQSKYVRKKTKPFIRKTIFYWFAIVIKYCRYTNKNEKNQ